MEVVQFGTRGWVMLATVAWSCVCVPDVVMGVGDEQLAGALLARVSLIRESTFVICCLRFY